VGLVHNQTQQMLQEVPPPSRAVRKAAVTPSPATPSPAAPQLHDSFNVDGTNEGRGLEIVIVIDEIYLQFYYRQAWAMRCYAGRHGYALTFLNSNPLCHQREFFFRKHCSIAEHLSRKPGWHTAVVMDADSVPAVLDRRLDAWLRGGEDLVFYEREWSPEVAAGNYIVRNTGFARMFLRQWADMEERKPADGVFSGSDNGAIHVLLPDILGVPCSEVVSALYGQLSHVGVNASDVTRIPMEYKNFVAAAEFARGPARRWVNISRWRLRGNITIMPRLHAWVSDYQVSNSKGNREIGSVFHHGVKTAEDVMSYFTENGLHTCTPVPNLLVDRETYLWTMMRYVTLVKMHYGLWNLPSGKVVPFHEVATHCCLPSLTCRPLDPGEALPLGGGAIFKDPLLAVARSRASDTHDLFGSMPAKACLDPEVLPVQLPRC